MILRSIPMKSSTLCVFLISFSSQFAAQCACVCTLNSKEFQIGEKYKWNVICIPIHCIVYNHGHAPRGFYRIKIPQISLNIQAICDIHSKQQKPLDPNNARSIDCEIATICLQIQYGIRCSKKIAIHINSMTIKF